jgi:hypothetical protein
MSEVAATREYHLSVKSARQSKRIVDEIRQLLREALSPRVCELKTEADPSNPEHITVTMRCADGRAVHQADVRAMFRILQLCEKEGIVHEIGDLEVIFDD